MLVLLDMEWLEDDGGRRSLTQLYAARVDAKWNTVCAFDAPVRPRDPETAPWAHMAFNGHTPEEFCAAEPEEGCVRCFLCWLLPDDVIWCWHAETKRTLKVLHGRYLAGDFPVKVRSIDRRVCALTEARGIAAHALYKTARACGIPTPEPEHRSGNDVAVMQRLCQTLAIPQTKGKMPAPGQKKPKPRRERNAKILAATEYNYLYAPGSAIFHCRSCKQLLRVSELHGTVYYETASQARRPCKLCRPDQQPHVTRQPKEAPEPKSAPPKPEPVKARLLGNQWALLPETRIVGCCHNRLHPGKLTKGLMIQHDCLGKNCRHFEKYEDAGYWKERDRQEKEKEKNKRLRRVKKEQEAAEEAAHQALAALFQSYIDDAGYQMQIIRVDMERRNQYRVFYVSEYPFADGNRFPEFLETVRFFFPFYRLNLRHIRDVDGHFVTIEEYRQRMRK